MIGIAGLVFVSGCSNCSDWMPLREGRSWRYLMRQAAEVVEVRCDREIRVGDSDGWVLSGLGGETTLAWDGCILRAGQLGAMTFDPPIAILQADKVDVKWNYSGKVTSRTLPGKADVSVVQEAFEIEGESKSAGRRVTMTVETGDGSIEIVTVFSQGVGIVSQEQRNEGRTVSSVRLMNDRG